MPRKPNKVEVQKFSDYVRAQLESQGAILKHSHTFKGERIPRTNYTWTVDTVGGPADISIFRSGFEFFVQFHDLERAKACFRFNLQASYTGKWNHSYSDRVFRDVKIHLDYVLDQLFTPLKANSYDTARTNSQLDNSHGLGHSPVQQAGG